MAIIDFILPSPDRIGARELSRATGMTERENRREICVARINGEIIGSDASGYFIPQSPQELASYYRTHHKRAITGLRGLQAVRKALQAAGVDVRQIEGRTGGKVIT